MCSIFRRHNTPVHLKSFSYLCTWFIVFPPASLVSVMQLVIHDVFRQRCEYTQPRACVLSSFALAIGAGNSSITRLSHCSQSVWDVSTTCACRFDHQASNPHGDHCHGFETWNRREFYFQANIIKQCRLYQQWMPFCLDILLVGV